MIEVKVVVTGFDPFGGEAINLTFGAIKKLPAEIAGAKTIKAKVSTVFDTDGEKVVEAVETHQPDMVIRVRQAGGRQTVTVEKVATNSVGVHIPDNTGQQPSDAPLAEDGATVCFTNLPIKAMIKNCHDHQPPTAISYAAGASVCNDITYHLLRLINTKYPTIRNGSIHVPFLPEQTIDKPTFAFMLSEVITGSLLYMIGAVVKTQEDIQL